jgi:hypothetical protein
MHFLIYNDVQGSFAQSRPFRLVRCRCAQLAHAQDGWCAPNTLMHKRGRDAPPAGVRGSAPEMLPGYAYCCLRDAIKVHVVETMETLQDIITAHRAQSQLRNGRVAHSAAYTTNRQQRHQKAQAKADDTRRVTAAIHSSQSKPKGG